MTNNDINKLQSDINGIKEICAERGQTLARIAERSEHQRDTLNEIKASVDKLTNKLDQQLELQRNNDNLKHSQLNQRLREIDQHVWSLIVKVSISWTILNAIIITAASLIISNAIAAN